MGWPESRDWLAAMPTATARTPSCTSAARPSGSLPRTLEQVGVDQPVAAAVTADAARDLDLDRLGPVLLQHQSLAVGPHRRRAMTRSDG